MKRGKYYIGTSGWHYRHWIGTFYPADTKPNQQFEIYKQHFNTVEINNSFYRLPSIQTFESWRTNSPETFLFVVKGSRFITHQKKLIDPVETTQRFFENVRHLGSKLGPILFQLPPGWKKNFDRLEAFLQTLPSGYRYVFEFRNSTWYDDDVLRLLEQYNCAFCIYELAGHLTPLNITADFIYVRLHGPTANKYSGSYSEMQLKEWAERCRDWQQQGADVFVFFDNDDSGYAAFNALTLKNLLDNYD